MLPVTIYLLPGYCWQIYCIQGEELQHYLPFIQNAGVQSVAEMMAGAE